MNMAPMITVKQEVNGEAMEHRNIPSEPVEERGFCRVAKAASDR